MPCPAVSRRRAGRPRLELADVFRSYADRLPPLGGPQARVVRDILACRTAALGGHIQECDHCAHREISYDSCRNRHCPKCQGLAQARWLEAQQALLLPTAYHHVVFTVPAELHPIFRAASRRAYALLFAAVAETLREVALRPKNLGARIGFTTVLHTWTQKLLFHPHIHCIVTGGGLSPDGSRWIASKPGFLFPVRILAAVFRGKLLRKLERGLARGTLRAGDEDPARLLRKAARKRWVVHSRPPVAGPEQVLRYLSRYTHRIALSNERLIAFQDDRVTFRWKDRAHGNATKLLTLHVAEFLRRFLLHLLPKGLVRIRHYGLLANRHKGTLVPRCRQLLGDDNPDTALPVDKTPEAWPILLEGLTGEDLTLCPRCGNGHLIVTRALHATPPPPPVLTRARAP